MPKARSIPVVEPMNEQARVWADWIKSRDGKQCAELVGLRHSPDPVYLRNRLWHAFMAGYEAAKSEQKQTIADLQSDLALLRSAVKYYGRHTAACAQPQIPFTLDCVCGLDKIMEHIKNGEDKNGTAV